MNTKTEAVLELFESVLWAVGIFLVLVITMLGGCGTAQSITAGAACNTLLVSLGEAKHLAPERAVADIRTVSAVCRRLQEAPDAGADAGTDGGAL